MSENPSTATTPRLEEFTTFVHQMLKEWQVQGTAIAIVRDGQVIFQQGFGKRDTKHDLDVTPQTLFPIASCSKAFTTAALAILADEGRLDWDTPIRTYIPTFRLADPFASERLTARDLVSHRSGLPRHDLAWYNSTASRKELFERLPYLEPTKDFRTLWQYQNLMYMAAGYLIEQITGQTWEEFVRVRIFEPLGMRQSNFSIVETSEQAENFSHPYKESKSEVNEIAFYGAQGAIGPAGAIVSNIEELSNWLQLHLNKGLYNDQRILSESQVTQLHAPQMVIPGIDNYPERPFASYALGWFVQPYRGYPMIHHGGNIDGFSSLVSLFPGQNIGIAVLTNMSGSPVPTLLTYAAFEHLMGLERVDWHARAQKTREEFKAAEQQGQEQDADERIPDTQPSHRLEAYVGTYTHPGYGTFGVTLEGEELYAEFNQMKAPLKHYHYDIFSLEIERFDINLKASFQGTVRGDIDTLIVPLEPTANDIVFKRSINKQLTEKSFLEQFIGEYEVLDTVMVVVLKGEQTLQATILGQPDYELLPYKETEFHVKGLSGIRINFVQGAEGQIVEGKLTLPYGVFNAKKK
ncbi:serine hydrolase [Ktedonobacter robiniae]|uniref:Penicillin-binding protein n=1 Tax=Ktedonobacter robiniae TaxID=2778365 RepID=A0ABQ3V2D4_9CHLR|nr:serine hydrolase [Ktedonobacter robiniae]GHO59107.1 penicillin-binding protein [Ktedonobacter robiniae]